eukprot:5011399-Prymnesium_polylepis.1
MHKARGVDMFNAEGNLEQSNHARCRLCVPKVRFRTANCKSQLQVGVLSRCSKASHFRRVTERRACAMSLQSAHGTRRQTRSPKSSEQESALSASAGGGETCTPPILPHSCSGNMIFCLVLNSQHERSHTFRTNIAIRRRIERLATAVNRKHARRREQH